MKEVDTLDQSALDLAARAASAEPAPAVADPEALPELMPAMERLIRVGVYYPPGHPSCDEAAAAVRHAIQMVAGRAFSLRIEVQNSAMFVQGLDLDLTGRGVAGFKRLLEEVGIVDLAIDRDISAEDLYRFVTRLLEIRQDVRSSRTFSQVSVDGMPAAVRIRGREYLARGGEQAFERDGDEEGVGPGLETLLAALKNQGLDRRQLALCQRFLQALPQHLANRPVRSSGLPQTTWQDVESMLLKAVRQRSFERASNAAQNMAARKNLGSLMSLFEEIGDESANQNWHEAVDLLLTVNRRPLDAETNGSMGEDMLLSDEEDASDLEADLREALGDLPVVANSGQFMLLPGNHLEELSVLLQMLKHEQPVSAVAKVQRRILKILEPPLSDDELMAVAGGIRHILEQPPADHVDAQVAVVLEILRRLVPDAPPKLICALSAALPTDRRSGLWPFAINELLMAGSTVPPDQHQVLVEIVSSIPLEAVADLAPRVDQLEALRDRRIEPPAAKRLPVTLYRHFAALLASSGRKPLGGWLLEAVRRAPPCGTSRAVVPLLHKMRPTHRDFLVAILSQRDDHASQLALESGASSILRNELPRLDRRMRQEDWVTSAVKLVHALDLPEAEAMLTQIRQERRWFILPAWPGDLRRIAGDLLKEREEDPDVPD